MLEKEAWAHVAADLYKKSSNCNNLEESGFRIGWIFGADAMRGRIDKRLAVIQNAVKANQDAHDLIRDLRVAILQFGEGKINAGKLS